MVLLDLSVAVEMEPRSVNNIVMVQLGQEFTPAISEVVTMKSLL